MSDTPNLDLPLVPSNSLQPSVPINEALQDIDALLRPGCIVQAMDIAADPTTTSGDVGKMWVVAAGGSGDWTGKDDQIALCTAANVWKFYVPEEGWEVRNLDEARKLYVYAGSSGWIGGIDSADVSYDNTISGLTSNNVKLALDEIAAAVGITGNAMTYIGSASVSGSAASSVAISGLDLDSYRAFLVTFAFNNATGSDSDISLYYNADTTATNYDRQALTVSSTTTTAARANTGYAFTVPANDVVNGTIWITKDRDGHPRCNIQSNRGALASIVLQLLAHGWTGTANVTGMTFSASVANSLTVGSVFNVFGVN